jgi:hypothetical protein
VKIGPKSYDPSVLVIIVGPFLVSLAFSILYLWSYIAMLLSIYVSCYFIWTWDSFWSIQCITDIGSTLCSTYVLMNLQKWFVLNWKISGINDSSRKWVTKQRMSFRGEDVAGQWLGTRSSFWPWMPTARRRVARLGETLGWVAML